MSAALRWFAPLARWLRLGGAGQGAAGQEAAGQEARPGTSGDANVPFAAASGPDQGVSAPWTAGGPTTGARGPWTAGGAPAGASDPWTAAGPPAGVSGPVGPAGPAAAMNGPEGRFEGSEDVTGPLVGISGQSGIPADRPAVRRDRPRRRKFGTAMRRLMVTPTFAAGLGVVVAASLAANMTKTVLHFSSPLPGRQCPVGNCHLQPNHGGTLASARPGVPIPAQRKGGALSSTPGAGSGSDGGGPGWRGAHGGHGHLWITYQVTEQWPGGFADQITIGGLAGRGDYWSLAVAFPGARIAGVQGAAWLWRSTDSGVAQGTAQGTAQGGGQEGDQPGGNHRGGHPQGGDGQGGESSGSQGIAQFMITVDGQPTAPSGCSIDGEPCAFSATGPR